MVYLTGDTHGDIDRFRHGRLRWLSRRDTVVVLGDFGFVWDGSKEEQKKLDWLRKRPYTLLFLDGCHENYDCFGGAESQDKEEREPGVNWWPQEMPSDEEYARCEKTLEENGWQVDYVLTHDAPSRFLDFTALALGESNRLHLFLDKILLRLHYEKWFFGCYHKDVALSTKSRCVFCEIIPMK